MRREVCSWPWNNDRTAIGVGKGGVAFAVNVSAEALFLVVYFVPHIYINISFKFWIILCPHRFVDDPVHALL